MLRVSVDGLYASTPSLLCSAASLHRSLTGLMVTELQTQVLQIRAAAELLGLPQTAACTAITLLKRISTQDLPVTQLCAQDYVAACLFLACKIEEVCPAF